MIFLNSQEIDELLNLLDENYPVPKCALSYKNPWQLLFAVILSAQCTDVRVNIVTEKLFKKYPTLSSFYSVTAEELENDIRSTGFYRNKAKSIRESARILDTEFGGSVPASMEELLKFPGVARKTANVVLGECFGLTEGIAVDTHVFRLSRRLGLADEKNAEKTEKVLMQKISKDRWTKLSHQLIMHGRAICHARKPACGECCIERLCAKNLQK